MPESAISLAMSGLLAFRKYLNACSRSFWFVGATMSSWRNVASTLAVSFWAWYCSARLDQAARLNGAFLAAAWKCLIASLVSFLARAICARQYSARPLPGYSLRALLAASAPLSGLVERWSMQAFASGSDL